MLSFFVARRRPAVYARRAPAAPAAPLTYAVLGRRAAPVVVRTVVDGELETTRLARPGDVIVTGPLGESYAMPAARFAQLYERADHTGHVSAGAVKPRASAAPRLAARVPRWANGANEADGAWLAAPWGGRMRVRPGDYVVADGEGRGMHRVAARAFRATYERAA